MHFRGVFIATYGIISWEKGGQVNSDDKIQSLTPFTLTKFCRQTCDEKLFGAINLKNGIFPSFQFHFSIQFFREVWKIVGKENS